MAVTGRPRVRSGRYSAVRLSGAGAGPVRVVKGLMTSFVVTSRWHDVLSHARHDGTMSYWHDVRVADGLEFRRLLSVSG